MSGRSSFGVRVGARPFFRRAATGTTLLGLVAASHLVLADEGVHLVAGGSMRVLGVAFDNLRDFKDSQGGQFRDNENFYQSRFRLVTVAESPDWKARAVWALEVGDITWGDGGGASGGEYSGCNGATPDARVTVSTPGEPKPVKGKLGAPGPDARVGPSSGGCLGSDGINVETKSLYVRFELPFEPHARIRLGAAPFRFLPGARLRMFSADTFGLCACLDDRPLPPDVVFDEFTNDDVFQIQLDWQPGRFRRSEGPYVREKHQYVPEIDVHLATGKISEDTLPSNDDVDFYTGRLGISHSSATDDLYIALEGLVINQRNLPGADLGDTYWFGGSLRWETPLKRSPTGEQSRLYAGISAVYGRRAIKAAEDATCGNSQRPCREAGYGFVGWTQARTYRWILTGAAWYASGDDERSPRRATNARLTKDSHRLPVPVAEKSWGNPPLVGEWVLSTSWFGAPELGQSRFRNLSGTSGIGASAQRKSMLGRGYVHWGAGLGVVAASGAPDVVPNPKTGEATGGWGKWVVEADVGFVYRFHYNPNFSFRGLAGYMVPERSNPAWAGGFVTQFDF